MAVPGADASASGNTTLGLELSYDITPLWTGRFLIGVPPTTTLTGTDALNGTGTLGKDGFITNLDVKSAFGAVAEIGADIPLEGGWSIGLDVRKIFLKTKADGVLPAMGGAAAHADVRLDPLVVFASIGRRF